ncbi:MAG: phosphoribosyltransferase [Patescibacteria group bacterium]|nr:phosphoribosyltransferase [Patescibacteria group bacterium]
MEDSKEKRQQEIRQIFAAANAIVTGDHFVYAAGEHGSAYVNKDAIYLYPSKVSRLCRFIAEEFVAMNVQVVVGPVVGGVALSQWVAFHLGEITGRDILAVIADKVPVLGLTKEQNPYIVEENFVIKRGYDACVRDRRVLVVEDILNSGMSVKKVINVVNSLGGNLVGVGALCNRGKVTGSQIGTHSLMCLMEADLEKFPEAECPLCQANVPVNTKLGKGKDFLQRKGEFSN